MSGQSSDLLDILVVGGGASGFFGALAAAEAAPGRRILIVEKGPECLSKVRISGGGRCNVTHSCFDARALSGRYPRGGKALLGAFTRFNPADTLRWFAERGVTLKTEADGRMFPDTDRSATIIECLESEARRAGVRVRVRCGVDTLRRSPVGFDAVLHNGERLGARRVLLATGGCKAGVQGALLSALGHAVVPPVPSLFTFPVGMDWVRTLAGLSVAEAEVSVPECGLRETGPVLFTHWGLSGPAVLRLSAWGARELHAREYRFVLRVRWVGADSGQVAAAFTRMRAEQPRRNVVNTPLFEVPARLWEALALCAGISPEVRWNQLSKAAASAFAEGLLRTHLPVAGKSTNKDEFVTCGGVNLREVDFKTMESRLCPGLFFAGEVLDVDGITGGFNFQAAWTTGWLAGRAMARAAQNDLSGISP